MADDAKPLERRRRRMSSTRPRRREDRRSSLHRRARPVAALLDPRPRPRRGALLGGDRVRRVVDPQVPDDRRVGHAAHARPDDRPDGPLLRGAHHRPRVQREGPGHDGGLPARPQVRGPEGRALPQADGHRGHRLHRAGAGVLHPRLGEVRPGLQLRLLSPGLGGPPGTRGRKAWATDRYKQGYFPVPRWTTSRTSGPTWC